MCVGGVYIRNYQIRGSFTYFHEFFFFWFKETSK